MPIPHEADSNINNCSRLESSSGTGSCRWKSGHTLRQTNLKRPSRPQRYAAPSPVSLASWPRKQMLEMDASWVLIEPLPAPRQNRELDWLVEELRETLTNLKHGLEDCYALLAPIDPGSTLVLSTPRNEIVKGHVTRVGTRIVKGVCSSHRPCAPPLAHTRNTRPSTSAYAPSPTRFSPSTPTTRSTLRR